MDPHCREPRLRYPFRLTDSAVVCYTTAVTPKELLLSIEAGKFCPAYYFFGSEDYRIVEAEKYVAHAFLPDMQLLTNYRRLDGRKTAIGELLNELASLPMLGERQVVAVANFQSYKPTEVDRVLKMLEPPDPNRIVLFSSPSSKSPNPRKRKKTRFWQTMESTTTAVEFMRLRTSESEIAIRHKLSQQNHEIEADALRLLVTLTDGNRGALDSEVEKLCNFVEDGARVRVEDIRAVASGFEIFSVFDLADKILAGNETGALVQARKLVSEGQSATGVLLFLGRHYMLLYLVQNSRPLEPGQQWLARKIRPQTGILSNEQLERAIMAIAETDSAIRNQLFRPPLALERLVVKLLQDCRRVSGEISGRN